MALDPRVAITFTPGVPPIMTRLVRWYEKGFVVGRLARFRQAFLVVLLSLLFFAAALGAAYVMTNTSGVTGTPGVPNQPVWRNP